MGRRSSRSNDEDEDQDVVMIDEDTSNTETEDERPRRRSTRGSSSSSKRSSSGMLIDSSSSNSSSEEEVEKGRRRSGRSTKFKASMKVPSDSIRDLYRDDDSDDDKPIKQLKPKAKAKASKKVAVSPPKSRGRHNNHRRRSNAKSVLEFDDDDDDGMDEEAVEEEYVDDEEEEDDYDEEEEDEDDESMKIQRILAVRSETRKTWKEICKSMNSSEVTDGSRWFQPQDDEEDDEKGNIVEERFLVKWNQLSYLHVSWETHGDLMDQVENAKNYMSTFFRKQVGGCLFGQDERKDGDYFDPGMAQIDRILGVEPPEGMAHSKIPSNWMEELAVVDPVEEYGIVLDNKEDPKAFEAGAGRQFLVKWASHNYSESTYEFERDLWLMDQKETLMEKLKEYYERTKRPTRKELKSLHTKAEEAMRRSYLFLGEKSRMDAAEKESKVKEYQEDLTKHVFRNGGSLRDYQAEGVTWFLSNYVNSRSCILADEMGLGKTLQTAAFVNLLVDKMHKRGPFLICVPLSTLAHWQREFIGWTGLNTIVYHGSADDRKAIRENEFAFPRDRPQNFRGGINALYLKKCQPAIKPGQSQWMATVVVTTPEMLVADDWNELSYVKWQALVVDEAHRLKNHNSKLAATMRKEQFQFEHKILLTGTPIQNDVKEFWTLLNFIDPENYGDVDEFMEEYGDMKSKEKIDALHEQIRPYILRRLKEDVEKSVPPKEETLIEVELTLAQKQYYRALYEKNVGFLHKNKKKALDGPSLNNLAMQLRKCCNHLFLLNGVEEDMRVKEKTIENEGDFVTNGSGKLVLLDKLLPRLKENGHRILIFSQFKIMLDILEDYLHFRQYKFERIDGSITGQKRQSAIDRFQDPAGNGCEPPFVMLLSTRAGGVGINLTAADTCVIFDSDWNPQNDIQAMARCHRIGQTKHVKVYRLLTRKTYEMQMFHMSSLKMGLDQAVLTGFESSSSGEGAMTKEEVERLLRHGAYDIFNEDKAGNAEQESNNFVQQDIDSILSRRSRKIVHANTGSGSNAAGGTFSKASFVHKSPTKTGEGAAAKEDVDINDPDFWKKMVGEAKPEEQSILAPRKRNQANYNEKNMSKVLRYGSETDFSDSDDSGDDSDVSAEGDTSERTRWGGPNPEHWTKAQVEAVVAVIEKKGYSTISWNDFLGSLPKTCSKFPPTEILRMSWSMMLIAICETAAGEGRRQKSREDKKEESGGDRKGTGLVDESKEVPKSDREINEMAFQRLWKMHNIWAKHALADALSYVRNHDPRVEEDKDDQQEKIREVFKDQLWPSLQGRGWRVINEDDEDETYVYEKRRFTNPSAIMNEVMRIHPELQRIVIELLNKIEQSRLQAHSLVLRQKEKELSITENNIDLKSLQNLIDRYAPRQLLHDRTRKVNRILLRNKTLTSCFYIRNALDIVKHVDENPSTTRPEGDGKKLGEEDPLCDILGVDARSGLPHPLWTRKHDAVLIRSVAKHGWVDVDSSLKDIVNDKDIRWGFPFDDISDIPKIEISEEERKNLRATAERAAKMLNENPKVLEALTGFNKNLVIDSYGLTQEPEDDEMDEEKDDDRKRPWRVDDSLLLEAAQKIDKIQESVDLPAKKDFVKRAKYVIQKTLPNLQPGAVLTKAPTTTKSGDGDAKNSETYGYIVVDQGNRCNILLAETIRALVKASTRKQSQMRLMFQISHMEATSLKKMIESQGDKKKEVEELQRIMDQIALARFAVKRSITQGKNVLRVMLGDKPQAPRSNDSAKSEKMFPAEKRAPAPGTTPPKILTKKPKSRRTDLSVGEKAIQKSIKKAHEYKDGELFGFIKGEEDLGLQLTRIETYILMKFCSDGMPLLADMDNKKNEIACPKTWHDTAKELTAMAKKQETESSHHVQYCKQAVSKGIGQQNVDKKQLEKLAVNVQHAETEYDNKKETCRNAKDFQFEPDQRLAKKSIMLLEKIRAYGTSKVSSKGTNKYENYLGPKVPKWFGKELAKLAANYDILDDENRPQSWTTADISETIQNNPEYNKALVAAIMDKTSARQVTSQIAMLSKLRAILLQHNEKDFRTKLQRAMKQSKRLDDEWKRPDWWNDSNEEHSFLLLKKLTSFGFGRMSREKSIDGFGAPEKEYEDMADLGLTKMLMQTRANQLVRELYAIEDHNNMLQMVAKRRNKLIAKNSKAIDSLAVTGSKNSSPTNVKNKDDSVSPKSTGSAKKTTVQTGLKAFFSTTPSNGKKKTGNSPDSQTSKQSSPTNGTKRKESPLGKPAASGSSDNTTGSPPAEKKLKKAIAIETGPNDMEIEGHKAVDVVVID